MPSHTLRTLLVRELQKLYGAEHQLLIGLPAMMGAATALPLAATLREHHGKTLSHALRLEECLSLLGEVARAVECKEMEYLLKVGTEMVQGELSLIARDSWLISAAARVEAYEIAAYSTCVKLALQLNEESIETLLRLTLEEERAVERRLRELAAHHPSRWAPHKPCEPSHPGDRTVGQAQLAQ